VSHWQELVHVCVPVSEPYAQLCTAGLVHGPSFEQADHADAVPSALHVRVMVPQFPQPVLVEQVHTPEEQATPLTQVLPHAPQLVASVCSLTHVPPQSVYPALHAQAPHAQALLHVSVPFPSQVFVAPTAHVPCPVHADHADQTPLPHVRVWVPQSPHACDAAPGHVHAPLTHVETAGAVSWGHAWAHAPQLAASLVTSTQDSPQAV
jgi:hypothetical protein